MQILFYFLHRECKFFLIVALLMQVFQIFALGMQILFNFYIGNAIVSIFCTGNAILLKILQGQCKFYLIFVLLMYCFIYIRLAQKAHCDILS